MQGRREECSQTRSASAIRRLNSWRLARLLLSLQVIGFIAHSAWAGQAGSQSGQPLPEAPQPQLTVPTKPPSPGPCQAGRSVGATAEAAVVGAALAVNDVAAGSIPKFVEKPAPCPPLTPLINWYARFLDGPTVKRMTPKEKAWLAVRNIGDPFNLITIAGEAGIAVASNSHSAYGPGFPGWGRYMGVSLTQDMTGEFFGTFLIPSIAHQDPHYHRMPNATMKRRIAHALYQVVWTQGDNGNGMPNYANLAGFAIDDEISNLYVPDRETDARATSERYATALATAPIDNFVTEFVPDLARHIHVQIVVIQRVINQVASKDNAGTL